MITFLEVKSYKYRRFCSEYKNELSRAADENRVLGRTIEELVDPPKTEGDVTIKTRPSRLLNRNQSCFSNLFCLFFLKSERIF